MRTLTTLVAAMAVLFLLGTACGGATPTAAPTSTPTPQPGAEATEGEASPTPTELSPTATEEPPTPTQIPPTPAPATSTATQVPPTTTPTEQPPTATSTPAASAAVRVIEVEALAYEFVPGRIEVKKGETVRFKVTSPDIFHTFSVKQNKEAEADMFSVDVFPDEPAEIEYTFQEVGELYLYCKPHEALDMTGTIVITEE